MKQKHKYPTGKEKKKEKKKAKEQMKRKEKERERKEKEEQPPNSPMAIFAALSDPSAGRLAPTFRLRPIPTPTLILVRKK